MHVATVWSQHYTYRLEAIQRRAAHFVMPDYCQISSVSAMINLLMQSISRQHEELRLIMYLKIVELPLPDYITPAPIESFAKTVSNL